MGAPNNIKKQLVEGLWEEIEKAVYRSPDVRQTLALLTEIDPKGDVSEYNLHLDIEKLNRLIQKEKREQANGPNSSPYLPMEDSTAEDQGQLTLFRTKTEEGNHHCQTAQLRNLSYA